MMSNEFENNQESINSIHSQANPASEFRSLQELIDRVSGKNIRPIDNDEDSGLAEPSHFPFLAIVGQYEMKMALTLTLINPRIGGVLLLGPRGTGKSTAIQGLTDLLAENEVSRCFYGCLEEDILNNGIDAVCPECAQKYASGIPLSMKENVHLVQLPLNAKLKNVIGGLDKHQLAHHRMRVKRGILAMADNNILYIDEINLLQDEIINAILDAAAMGKYTIRRGSITATYNSRFILIASMNPEEGQLRPQILDRFGLRIITRGLSDDKERYEAYSRSIQYRNNPRLFEQLYQDETLIAKNELDEARKAINKVVLPDGIAKIGIKLIKDLQIDSIRAEISLFETAKALAAANKDEQVTLEDLTIAAPLALRLRKTDFISKFFEEQKKSDQHIVEALNHIAAVR